MEIQKRSGLSVENSNPFSGLEGGFLIDILDSQVHRSKITFQVDHWSQAGINSFKVNIQQSRFFDPVQMLGVNVQNYGVGNESLIDTMVNLESLEVIIGDDFT